MALALAVSGTPAFAQEPGAPPPAPAATGAVVFPSAPAVPVPPAPAPPAPEPNAFKCEAHKCATWWRPLDDGLHIGLGVAIGVAALPGFVLPPAQRALIGPVFDPANPQAILDARYSGDIGKPYAEKETVTIGGVLGLAALGGGLVIGGTILQSSLSKNTVPGPWEMWPYDTFVGFADTLVLTFNATMTLKYAFGRLRPDFQDRVLRFYCGTGNTQKGSNLVICPAGFNEATITSNELNVDGRSSFPSGHSSLSFATATYGLLVLGGQYQWGERAHNGGVAMLAAAAQLGMLGTATWVAGTRVADGRHNVSDVMAGAVIGILSANFGYWQNFDAHGNPRRLQDCPNRPKKKCSSVRFVPYGGGVAMTGQF
jgi:membrane-associated phospholipid phosphatase